MNTISQMLASHNLQILNGQKQGWCEALRQPTMYTLRDIGETGGRVLKQKNLLSIFIHPTPCLSNNALASNFLFCIIYLYIRTDRNSFSVCAFFKTRNPVRITVCLVRLFVATLAFRWSELILWLFKICNK